MSSTISRLLEIRQKARENNDFEVADLIRDFIEDTFQVKIIDTNGGVAWHEKNNI
jgi:cysteinyl-tRNA synthetase